jgi:hypothetical protein
MTPAALPGSTSSVFCGRCATPGPPWSETSRFFFNVVSAGTLAAVEPALWATRTSRRELKEGERLALGFDGSHSRDGTALVACTADGFLVPIEIIERPEKVDEWRVDRGRIHRAIEHAFAAYDVVFLYGDPWGWRDELDQWADKWPECVVDFPTNSIRRMAPAIDRFRTVLDEGRLTHRGDPDLTRHALNARLRKVGRDEDGRPLHARKGRPRPADRWAGRLRARLRSGDPDRGEAQLGTYGRCPLSDERRRVPVIREVAVADNFALIGGGSAEFLGRLLAGYPGGLERLLVRSEVARDRRDEVLRAVGALLHVGANWRLEQKTRFRIACSAALPLRSTRADPGVLVHSAAPGVSFCRRPDSGAAPVTSSAASSEGVVLREVPGSCESRRHR